MKEREVKRKVEEEEREVKAKEDIEEAEVKCRQKKKILQCRHRRRGWNERMKEIENMF